MPEKGKVENRKLQTTGGSTYTVSLPKQWVEEIGLKTGDDVAIEDRGSSLLLSPPNLRKKNATEALIEVEPDESGDSMKRKILSLYLAGFNKITIRAANRLQSKHRSAIKELARNKLVGTEIISESIEEISLQTLLSYSDLSVKDSLNRMYRVTTSMQENAIAALEETDKELAEDVIELDEEVDRFQMYLIRAVKASIDNPSLLPEMGLESEKEGLSYRLVSRNVERAADHAAHIAEHVLEMEKPIEEDLLKLYKELNDLSEEVFKKSLDSLLEEDYKSAEEAISENKKLYSLEEEINRALAEKKVSETMSERLLIENIRRIAEHGFNIAEIVMNMTVEKNHSIFSED